MKNIIIYIGSFIYTIVTLVYIAIAGIIDLTAKVLSLLGCFIVIIIAAFASPFCKNHFRLHKFRVLYKLGGLWGCTENYPLCNYLLNKFQD